MSKGEESQMVKTKSDFLTRNQDIIAGWKPQAMTYSTKDRNLAFCDIVPLPFETVKTRVNGTIWAYHVASGQQAISPYQEKFSGCFLVQKNKTKQPPGDMERITDHFHVPEAYKQQQRQRVVADEAPQFKLYDSNGQEMLASRHEPDFFELSEQQQSVDGQQEQLDLKLDVPFVRVVYREADAAKNIFATPVVQQPGSNDGPVLPPGKGPFSTIKQKQKAFQTPNAQYSVRAIRGADPAFSTQQFQFQFASPGYDQFPLLELNAGAAIPLQPTERPPRLPRK